MFRLKAGKDTKFVGGKKESSRKENINTIAGQGVVFYLRVLVVGITLQRFLSPPSLRTTRFNIEHFFSFFFFPLSIFHQAIRAPTEWTRIERRPIHGNRDDSRNARSVPAQEERDAHTHTHIHTPVNDPCRAVLRVHRLSRHSRFPSMKGRYRSSRDDRNFFDSILTSITLVLCELGQRKNGKVGSLKRKIGRLRREKLGRKEDEDSGERSISRMIEDADTTL